MRALADEQRQQFGSEIRLCRQAKGMGLRQFARAIPTSPSYVCMIENGRGSQPSAELLCRMAEVLEIPPTRLFVALGKLPPDMLQAFWQHPAVPAILSTIPGMTLDDAQTFCRHVLASLTQIPDQR